MLNQVLVALVLIEVVLPLVLYVARNKLLFFPRNSVTAESRLAAFARDVEADVIRVRRPDGRELATYDARPAAGAAPPGNPHAAGDPRGTEPVVLFLHGNGGDIAMRSSLLSWLVQHSRMRWVMPDYSGYGGNEGSPSEDEVCIDGLAAFDALVEAGVPPGRIVLYGESLGGAVALHVASERRPAGVVLQSSFASLGSMAREIYPWLPLAGLLVHGSFPSRDRVAALDVPVLVVHGDRDRIVPPRQGRKLHAAAPEGTEFLSIRGAGHNDLFEAAGPAYVRGLAERFRAWTAPAPSGDER